MIALGIGIALLVFSAVCLVAYHESIRREIQNSRDWLKAFQAEDERQQREFLKKLREKLR